MQALMQSIQACVLLLAILHAWYLVLNFPATICIERRLFAGLVDVCMDRMVTN